MKPKCKLTGENGNVFNLAGKVIRTLKKAKCSEERCGSCHHKFLCYTERSKVCYLVGDFEAQMMTCKSYDEALQLMMEYVEVT